jgi:CopG family nickel-responsive transcriptional regulator
VVSATHAHLDHEHCIETVILKGPTNAIQAFADEVCVERGVRFGSLNLVSVEARDASDGSGHDLAQSVRDRSHRHLSPAVG